MKKIIKIQDLNEQSLEISVSEINNLDFISLTDMAKYKNPKSPDVVIRHWIRTQKTIEFLMAWEEINNPNFKSVHLDRLKENYDLTTKKWVEKTDAIGITSKKGRGGGTYAHRDIAFEFATWIDPKFKLFVIKDYQRLKEEELAKGENWKGERLKGKSVRRSLTNTIQRFVEYAKNQGSENADWYYSTITVETYKALKLISKAKEIGKDFRDTLNQIHLQFLGTAENIALEVIEDEMQKGTHYKDIFKIAKEKVLEFARVVIPVMEFKDRPKVGHLF